MTTSHLQTRQLGTTGPTVGAVALGCMGMSGAYGPADEDESVATIGQAVGEGVTLVDTGDFYAMGHNELLVGRALRDLNRDDVTLSVKFGVNLHGKWPSFCTLFGRFGDLFGRYAVSCPP